MYCSFGQEPRWVPQYYTFLLSGLFGGNFKHSSSPPPQKKMKATSWYGQYACFLHYESLDYVILHYVRSCRDVFVGFSIQEGNFISHSLQTSVIETFLAHNGLFSGSFTTFLSLSLTQFYPAIPGWCSNKYCTVDLRSVY